MNRLTCFLGLCCFSCVTSTHWVIRQDGEIRNCSGGSAGGLIPAAVGVHLVVSDCVAGYQLVGFSPVEFSPSIGVLLDWGSRGLFISQVEPGGPADAAGIRVGRWLVSVDGKPTPDFLQAALALLGPAGTEAIVETEDSYGVSESLKVIRRDWKRP